jgi:hypothetical protein
LLNITEPETPRHVSHGVVIRRSIMQSLYRGLFVHLDFLWGFSYLTNTIVDVCFLEVSRHRDSDHSMFGKQARLARDAWPTPVA